MTIQYLTLKELCDMDFSSKFYNDYAEKKDMQEEYVTIKDVFLILEDGKLLMFFARIKVLWIISYKCFKFVAK